MAKKMGATFGLSILLLLMNSVAGCQTADIREEITDTPAATLVEPATDVVEKQQMTPTEGEVVEPTATITEAIEPRTLIICQGTESGSVPSPKTLNLGCKMVGEFPDHPVVPFNSTC